MWNKLVASCFAVASTVSLSAQTVEFIEPRNVQNVQGAEFSTYSAGGQYYVLHKKYRMMAPIMYDMQLDVYDANRKPVGSNPIDKVLEQGDANIPEGFFALKDKLIMCKSEFSKSSGSKMSYIYAYPFDATGRRQKKTLLSSFAAESAFNAGNFGVNTSPDGTKLVVFNELPYEKDGMERCTVTLFDDQFKQIWKKDFTFPYESAKAPKNEVYVNNAGTVFILKRIAVKKEHDKFSVFTFTDGGKNVVEKKIELENGFTISTWKHLFTPAGDLHIAGFYYMNKKVGINVETPDGTFLLKITGNGELSASKSVKIRSANTKITQLLSTEDGGYIIVGETVNERSTPKPGAQFEYNYEYSTGISHIIKMGSEGAMQWNYELNRNLRSSNDAARFFGIFAWTKGSDVNIFFTDELTNHDNKRQFVEFGTRWINLFQTIGPDGKMKSETLITDPRIGGKKGEYIFLPVTGSVYKDNKLFMLASRGLELVGATVSY
ncbi:MAG: hypothetical protein JNM88_03640 [Chitinophagaceae bacterium]|nr:hypothetical protein [Chitinophagaceae bacterium]